jgi:23S rRNA (cytidine2498-2'-O)-methyltransferase
MSPSLLLYCRPGFESETSGEILNFAKSFGVEGFVKAKSNSSLVSFIANQPEELVTLWQDLALSELIFARQILMNFQTLSQLPEGDRITPILAACEDVAAFLKESFSSAALLSEKSDAPFFDLFIEVPDTNEHKERLHFCKKFTTPLRIALEKKGFLPKKNQETHSPWRLHLLFLDSNTAMMCLGHKHKSSHHFMGIPRLKFPSNAPSRSTLKLEEAFVTFLKDHEQKELLKNGLLAVDLGAAPGGWTYQFVTRHIYVTAVDNGSMDKQLLDSGLVHHVKADGFKYIPPKPVHWMVCDMVEKPSLVAKLVTKWIVNKWAKNIIFNLKLPMKKRREEVELCLKNLVEECHAAHIHVRVQCKQLYHDREEVTVLLQI